MSDDIIRYRNQRKVWRKQRITQTMRQDVARRYGARPGSVTTTPCTYCGEQLTYDWTDHRRVRLFASDGRPTPCLDHVVPLAANGPHTADNLVPSCVSCNARKGAKPLAGAVAES